MNVNLRDCLVKPQWLLSIALSVITCSCDKASVEGGSDYDIQSDAIRFRYEMTRVAGGAFEQGDVISVSGYDGGALLKTTSYSYGSSYFESQDPITYEADERKEISFLAAYPVVADFDEEFDFTLKADQSSGDNYELSDLLIASTEPTDSSCPTLSFSHVMSNIVVAVKVMNGTTDVTSTVDITDFKINAKMAATCDLANGSYGATSDAAITVTPLVSGTTYSAIIAPQTIDENSEFITFLIDGDKHVMPLDDVVLQMLSGKQYSYTLAIDLVADTQTVEQLDGIINPWEDGLDSTDPDADPDSDPDDTVAPSVVTVSASSFSGTTQLLYSGDGLSIDISSGTVVYGAFNYVQLNTGSTIKFTASKKITKIDFGPSVDAFGDGTTISNTNGVWEGSLNSITFSIKTTSSSFTSLKMTLSAE